MTTAKPSTDDPDQRRQLRELRRGLRADRRALAAPLRAAYNRQLIERVAALEVFRNARRVAAFLAFDGEANPAALFQLAADKEFFLPVMRGRDQPLLFARYRHGDALLANRFGIPEPEATPQSLLDPVSLDLVVTPLVGFTENGVRLGVGGGYYDRSFAFLQQAPHRHRPLLLGFAFELQKLTTLPQRPWDVRLDAIATEAALYDPAQQRQNARRGPHS